MELTQTEKLLQATGARVLLTPADAPERALVAAESDLAFAIAHAKSAIHDLESALLRVTELRTGSESHG